MAMDVDKQHRPSSSGPDRGPSDGKHRRPHSPRQHAPPPPTVEAASPTTDATIDDLTATDAQKRPSRRSSSTDESSVGESSPRSVRVSPEPETTPPAPTGTAPATADDDDDVLPEVASEHRKYELSELFVNPNLSRKPSAVVLRKDPFCIPRATDNVPGYRPRFNPLNILVSEEGLLPPSLAIDFSEGIPGVPKPSAGAVDADGHKQPRRAMAPAASTPRAPTTTSSFLARKMPPPQTFGDKISTMGMLMGTLPRQAPSSPRTARSPTTDAPFADSLLELVATHDPPPLETPRPPQPPLSYQPTAPDLFSESDATMQRAMSNISISADAPYRASPVLAPTLTPPPPVLDQLMNYLPSRQFAEKRPPAAMIPPQSIAPAAATSGGLPAYGGASYGTSPYGDLAYAPAPVPPAPVLPPYEAPLLGAPAYLPPQHPHDQAYDHHQHQHQYHGPQQPQEQPPAPSQQAPAKKPRSKNVFRPCTMPGCTKGARGKSGLCQKHGGGKRCAYPNCPKGAQGSSNMCLFHGGGYRCTVEGCTTGARGTSGLCAKHGGYKRARDPEEDGAAHEGHGGPASKEPRLEGPGAVMVGNDG